MPENWFARDSCLLILSVLTRLLSSDGLVEVSLRVMGRKMGNGMALGIGTPLRTLLPTYTMIKYPALPKDSFQSGKSQQSAINYLWESLWGR